MKNIIATIVKLIIGALIGVVATAGAMHHVNHKKEIVKPVLVCTQQQQGNDLESLTYTVKEGNKVLAKEVLNYDTNTYNFTSNTYSKKGTLTSPQDTNLIDSYYANLMTVNK